MRGKPEAAIEAKWPLLFKISIQFRDVPQIVGDWLNQAVTLALLPLRPPPSSMGVRGFILVATVQKTPPFCQTFTLYETVSAKGALS